MLTPDNETAELIGRAKAGDQAAWSCLVSSFRPRLRRMVGIRMDRLLAARVDPSDVVQETLAEAARKLPQYQAERQLPFYPWLRELAWEQLVRLHRRHVQAQRRSVLRERALSPGLSQESELELAEQIAANSLSPSGQLVRQEVRQRVQAALQKLSSQDREILVMRHLEQLDVKEIAAILRISPKAVMMRRLRAFEHLRRLLGSDLPEALP